jgi:acryloyl-coenzyme A reductase
MRAVVVEQPGPPSVLKLRSVPEPALAPNDVRIAVKACGVCFHDVVVRNGTFRMGVSMPVILGHEVAGIVESVGSAVQRFKPGERVAATLHRHICGHCRYCRNGHETSCPDRVFLGDAGLNGGYAELVCIGEDNLLHLPPEVPFEHAAIAACAIGTELNAVRDVGQVRPGERVLVTGAGGGLGIHGVQLARLAGAFTIAVTTSEHKADLIKAAGADHVLVVKRGEDYSPQVKSLAGGEGVDVVIDNVGSPMFHLVRRSLADGGRWVLVGQLTGDFVSVSPAQLFLHDLRLLSAKAASLSQLADAVALLQAGRVSAHVEKPLPLEEAAAAHASLESGSVLGRLVIAP